MNPSPRSATERLTAGERYAEALASKDRATLIALLATPVDFQALTPGRHWQAVSAAQVIDEVVLGRWFGPGDEITELASVRAGRVGERQHVEYRLTVLRDGRPHLVEQQMYYEIDEDGRVSYARLLCSGYCPVA
jgi:hypothetical protein